MDEKEEELDKRRPERRVVRYHLVVDDKDNEIYKHSSAMIVGQKVEELDKRSPERGVVRYLLSSLISVICQPFSPVLCTLGLTLMKMIQKWNENCHIIVTHQIFTILNQINHGALQFILAKIVEGKGKKS